MYQTLNGFHKHAKSCTEKEIIYSHDSGECPYNKFIRISFLIYIALNDI